MSEVHLREGDRFALTDLRARKSELSRLITTTQMGNKLAERYVYERIGQLTNEINHILNRGGSDEATGSPSDL